MNLETRPRGGTFFALAMIVAGALLFLDNLGILPIEDVGAFWPLALVIYGMGTLWYRRTPLALIWSSTLIVAGVLLIFGNLHMLNVTAGRLWPLLLIALGASMLVDRSRWGTSDWLTKLRAHDWPSHEEHLRRRAERWQRKQERWQRKAERFGEFAGRGFAAGKFAGSSFAESTSAAPEREGSLDSRIDDVAIFFAAKRRVETQDFQGGELAAVFGSIEIDLSLSAMQPLPSPETGGLPSKSAVLEASAVFGAIEIVVPRNWRVVREGAGVFGSYEDQTFPRVEAGVDPPVLVVRGAAVFGSVVIKN